MNYHKDQEGTMCTYLTGKCTTVLKWQCIYTITHYMQKEKDL